MNGKAEVRGEHKRAAAQASSHEDNIPRSKLNGTFLGFCHCACWRCMLAVPGVLCWWSVR